MGRSREAKKLGEVVSEYITQRIGPRQLCFSIVAEAWDDVVPNELRAHCILTDLSEGRLKVAVDSPVYLYELQLCRDELLKEIQRRVRGKTKVIQPVRQLKFTVNRQSEWLDKQIGVQER